MILYKLRPVSVKVGESKTFKVYGKSFKSVRNVYLSGASYPSTFFNPFSASPRLSADYPGFNGYRLATFTSNNENTVVFTPPIAFTAGKVDVIVENPGGYGSLIKYTIYNTTNPWPLSSMPEYQAYEPYKKPWKEGYDVLGDNIIPDGAVYTLDGSALATIDGEDIIVVIQ